MKKMICLMAMLIIPGIAFADAESDIEEHCEEKWARNDAYQKLCVEKQLSAKNKIMTILNSARGDAVKGYAEACIKRWYPEFDKVGPCVKACLK